MTTNTIGAALAMVACGALLSIAGCESGNTAPENSPHTGAGGSKSPTLLSTCANIFTGVENCTIGTTDLVGDPAAGTVVVTGFAADGNGGVSGSFANAVDWSQTFTMDIGTRTGTYVHYTAISDGQAVGELHIARLDATRSQFNPTFTAADGGSSGFHVHVFNNGALVGGENDVDPQTPVFIVGSGDDDRDGGDKKSKPVRIRTFSNARTTNPNHSWESLGACEWTQRITDAGVTVSVRLPNGNVLVGDEVRFTEKVAAGQAVYNNFERIDMTGNLESYSIQAESSVPLE